MPIRSADEYIQSLRERKLKVYLLGELVNEPVDHPLIRPSINAVAETYRLAEVEPELASAEAALSGRRVNRFLHVTESVDDVVMQNRMQRRLGQLTGTCFQRCVGMDAINALYSVTYDIDAARGSGYHERFRSFVRHMQVENFVVGGAMTDPKGDRGKAPSEQSDPDLFVRVVERRPDGLVLRGAKMHQTGCINSHYIVVMPTQRLSEADRDYAVVAAMPVDAPGSPISTAGRAATRARSKRPTWIRATRGSAGKRRSSCSTTCSCRFRTCSWTARPTLRPRWWSASPHTIAAATCAKPASATC